MRNKDRYARGGACGAGVYHSLPWEHRGHPYADERRDHGDDRLEADEMEGEETCEGDSLETVTFMHFFIGAHSSWP